jgi:hypothetical protein
MLFGRLRLGSGGSTGEFQRFPPCRNESLVLLPRGAPKRVLEPATVPLVCRQPLPREVGMDEAVGVQPLTRRVSTLPSKQASQVRGRGEDHLLLGDGFGKLALGGSWKLGPRYVRDPLRARDLWVFEERRNEDAHHRVHIGGNALRRGSQLGVRGV